MSDDLIEVTADTVDEHGFFCCMSKRDSDGWKAKRAWLDARFAEGLRLYLLPKGQRGFVEFMPGESAWKPIEAAGWTVVHCLWVVGKSKGQGGGRRLIERCIADARAAGSRGVAVVASTSNFSTKPAFYERFGFRSVDEAPPKYRLMALPFGDAEPPRFTAAAKELRAPEGDGLVLQSSDQCPYHAQLAEGLAEVGSEAGLACSVARLETAEQLRAEAVVGHGTFGVAVDGEVLPVVYLPRDLQKKLAAR